jgi:hypothetical protein
MDYKRLIKAFVFEEDNRSKLSLGDKTRLHPLKHRLQLKEQSTIDPDDLGVVFPMDDGLCAKTWITEPGCVRSWLGFEVVATHTIVDGIVVTSLGFRLSDGTNEYWWNGSGWEINTSNWNDENEIAANIATFQWAQKKLQIVINLKTTNKLYTPMVQSIKVLYKAVIEFQEDLIYRTLVPLLKANIRPIAEMLIRLESDTSSINIADDYTLSTPYNVSGVDSVFNETDDPNYEMDIFDNYDSVNGVINLTTTVLADKVVRIRFEYEPEIVVTTSQDYTEIQKVPAVILDDINLVNATEYGLQTHVANKGDGTAVVLPPPIRGDLEIMAHMVTDKGVDQVRLADKMKEFLSNNPIIRSTGLDEEYRLHFQDEYDMRTGANMSDLHTGRLRFSIVGALFYMRDSIDKHIVQSFNTTVDSNLVI